MSRDNKISIFEPANEDTVQCLFYSFSPGFDESREELCKQINNTIKTLSNNYIWNRDEFHVYVPLSDSVDKGLPSYIQSTTCFGDNIEDEWFIVYLVLEISKQYKDLIVQIIDNDGDFLLIEAADNLPKWANPENTENRVFIYNNHIHIIPPEIMSLETEIEINAALNIINQSSESTKVCSEIEQAILKRIGNYPEMIRKNTHRAVVKLPSNLATLLILKPSLIAPIVDAYCNHDIIDAKACKKIDFNDCVNIEVTFTKFLYAKLIHSKLINSMLKHCTSENDKRSTLGLKLLCGFQMIMNNASTDLFSSKDYQKYVNSLNKNGYFKNNIEGSKEYNILLEKAKEYFSSVECPISTTLSHNISQLMLSNDYIQAKDSIKEKEITDLECTGDDEVWLNINPEQLNDLLLTRYGRSTKLKNNDVVSQAITTELSSFLKQTSDFEGIETNCNQQDEDYIEFESDQFVACMEKMLNIISSGSAEDIIVSEDSDDGYDDMNDVNDCDSELKAKLHNQTDVHDSNTILANIIQSMKEEKALTGPTSNILRSMGVHKSDLLDSDDDVD